MFRLSRRDFLKLSALLSMSLPIRPWRQEQPDQQGAPTNIVILLFDAMSARHLSIYGYPRNTTPHFARFAKRANVYHSHYSAGNFTTPGTTSLLTGLYPWTHRAINNAGLMTRGLTERNIFKLLSGTYQRVAFTQNLYANYILSQFNSDLDLRLSPASFDVANGIFGEWFQRDPTVGYRSFDDFLFKFDINSSNPASASLLFGTIQRLGFLRQIAQTESDYSKKYPVGLPNTDNYPIYYRIGTVFDGLISIIKNIKTPTLAYFHVYPPHEPYRPSTNFFSMFFDNYKPPQKPEHALSHKISFQEELKQRRRYDQYIADADSQFGRLLNALEQSGFLENSVVVVTGDHGQMFERGENGHSTPLLYDPVLHIPLLISTPGQNTRNDIYEPTNSVDVLPTLMHLANQPIQAWCEGALLPGLGGTYDPNRVTYSIEAKLNPAIAPIRIATLAMRKGPYKLIRYMGYEGKYNDAYELFNLEEDPEEVNNLYATELAVAAQMKAELSSALEKANSQFKG